MDVCRDCDSPHHARCARPAPVPAQELGDLHCQHCRERLVWTPDGQLADAAWDELICWPHRVGVDLPHVVDSSNRTR